MPLSQGGRPASTQSASQAAPVIIDGQPLFNVYGTSTYPANKRAKQIAARIIQLARDASFDPATLEAKEEEGVAKILAGDQLILAVFADDARIEGEIKPIVLAEGVIIPHIVQAIKKYRYEREDKILLAKGLRALLRTILLSVLIVFLLWCFRKIDQLLEQRFKRKIEELEAKSKSVLKARQIWSVLKSMLNLLRIVLLFAVIYFFVNFVLGLFPWTRFLSKTLLGYTLDPLFSIGLSVINFLPNLFFLAIVFFLFRYLLQLTKAFFRGVELRQITFLNFDAEWAVPTYRIVRLFIVIVGVVLAYPYIPGSQSEAFKGISILMGVLFSLGSSSIISNIIAGNTMIYRRAFKVGDRVKIGNNIGEILEMRQMVTHLRTLKNEEVVIPNSVILTGEITNYSTLANQQGLILHTTVGIGYEVPWRQVEAMLLLAAERTTGIKKEPPPFVLQQSLGDFAVTYELNVYCGDPAQMMQLYTALHKNILDVFNEYGVQIMTPNYMGDTEHLKVVPKDQWYAPPATDAPEAKK